MSPSLWILRPIRPLAKGDDPWEPWYDKCFGFVVRADSEEAARAFADAKAGDENRGKFLNRKTANTSNPWLDRKYSTCEPLTEDGEAGVIMEDVASA
jgi:hypothetical protein